MDHRRFVTISGFAGARAVYNGLWEVLRQNRSADTTPRCPLGHKQNPYWVEGSEITALGGRTGRMMICSAGSTVYVDWVKVEERRSDLILDIPRSPTRNTAAFFGGIAGHGGIPVFEKGKIIGGIGCSGGTDSQDEVATLVSGGGIGDSAYSTFWEALGKHFTANEGLRCKLEGCNANKINEGRSVRTGQSELANRRQENFKGQRV